MARLWSCADVIVRIVLPSTKESTDTSRPVINSSMTIVFPALPNFLSSIISLNFERQYILNNTLSDSFLFKSSRTFLYKYILSLFNSARSSSNFLYSSDVLSTLYFLSFSFVPFSISINICGLNTPSSGYFIFVIPPEVLSEIY